MQKLNIGLIHGENNEVHVIENVIISDKEEMNAVVVNFNGPVHAVIPNWNDHAYFLQDYDDRTLDWMIQNLYKLESVTDNIVVWTQLWQMVSRCRLNPMKFYNFVVNQYPHVKSQQILSSSLRYLSILINRYMPSEKITECKSKMFDVLITVLKNVDDNSLKTPIVDNMMSFITSEA